MDMQTDVMVSKVEKSESNHNRYNYYISLLLQSLSQSLEQSQVEVISKLLTNTTELVKKYGRSKDISDTELSTDINDYIIYVKLSLLTMRSITSSDRGEKAVELPKLSIESQSLHQNLLTLILAVCQDCINLRLTSDPKSIPNIHYKIMRAVIKLSDDPGLKDYRAAITECLLSLYWQEYQRAKFASIKISERKRRFMGMFADFKVGRQWFADIIDNLIISDWQPLPTTDLQVTNLKNDSQSQPESDPHVQTESQMLDRLKVICFKNRDGSMSRQIIKRFTAPTQSKALIDLNGFFNLEKQNKLTPHNLRLKGQLLIDESNKEDYLSFLRNQNITIAGIVLADHFRLALRELSFNSKGYCLVESEKQKILNFFEDVLFVHQQLLQKHQISQHMLLQLFNFRPN